MHHAMLSFIISPVSEINPIEFIFLKKVTERR